MSTTVVQQLLTDSNTYTVIEGRLAFKAEGDRIIVKEDKFKTGYECKACDGSGNSKESCSLCKGSTYEADGSTCRACQNGRAMRASGFKPCQDCGGKGTKGGLVIPEQSERRPTTGTVVSVGSDVKSFSVGSHVMYGNYAGYAITFKQEVTLRIMHENEVMCTMYVAKDLAEQEIGTVMQ